MSEPWIAYLTLFLSAFGAASFLPFYSEPVLAGLLVLGTHDHFALWLVATIGNTLGAAVNWWMGRFITYWQGRRWFPVSPEGLAKASALFRRYGTWTLLFAWLPIGGDALTFVAGIMRVRFAVFIVLVAVGKGARFAALVWALHEVAS